jgi:hypothetical protein
MRLPDGEWPCSYGRTRPLLKLNKTFYDIKQVNRKYYKHVFDFKVSDLSIQLSIADLCLFFCGNLGESNGIIIPVYVNYIPIIGTSVLVASNASRLYAQFKAASYGPMPDTFRYLGLTVTRDRSERSFALIHIGYIN